MKKAEVNEITEWECPYKNCGHMNSKPTECVDSTEQCEECEKYAKINKNHT